MMQPMRRARLAGLPAALAALLMTLASCGERQPVAPPPAPKAAPAPVPPASTSTAPVIPPGTAEDVTKKGTSTGMIGGESGTVAASGKPGSGTDSGAGTGASQASDSKTSDKK